MSRKRITICFHDIVTVNTGLSLWELVRRGNFKLGDVDLRISKIKNFHAQNSNIIFRHEIFLVRPDTAQDPQSGDLIIAYLGGDANKRILGVKQIDPKTYFWRGFHTLLVVRS